MSHRSSGKKEVMWLCFDPPFQACLLHLRAQFWLSYLSVAIPTGLLHFILNSIQHFWPSLLRIWCYPRISLVLLAF
jgi:hypothetical protein